MSAGITISHALQSQEHIVEISAFRFCPASFEVHSGDVVKWVNSVTLDHISLSQCQRKVGGLVF